jgi:hypothetical protein
LFIFLVFAFSVLFKTGFYFYSCGSDVDGSAVLCSAAGWSCFESAFPVLHPGIFRTDCCADSDYCEVSFRFIFLRSYYFCGFGVSAFLLMLVAVVYMMVWFCRFVLVS